MKIDRKLNFVLPVKRSDGSEIFVHSAPIDSNCFRTYYKVLAKTFSEIMFGIGPMAGPRVADRVLEDIATEMGIWDSKPGEPVGVQQGLLSEIQRRTSVIAPGERGWEPLPYHEAVQRGILEPDDAAEVNAALVFFSVGSHLFRQSEREMMTAALKHWSARIESSSCTEFANSLPTSTEAASTGEKVVALSVTRSIG